VQTRTAAAGSTGQDAAASAGIPLDLSLPRASFISESEFRREREAILFADWFCVGREESLPTTGDYLTADIAGESIIVARGQDGVLRGFYNLCRHRGSRLVPRG
jgi:glycine betaine catabolism A